MTHHGGAYFLRLDDGPWGAHDFWIRNDALVVKNFRIRDDSLPVDDAGFNIAARLIDDFGFHDGLSSWYYMLVHDSSGAVYQLALGDHSRRLLDGYESWATLRRGTYNWTLWHAV